jgi:hypothetical protein
MILSDEQKALIESALVRYGVTGLARKIGATRSTFYEIRRRGRGLTPDKFEQIRQLMQPQATQTAASGPSVAIAPPQLSSPSDTAAELQLLSTWLQGLSKTNLIKVIEFVAELKRSEET